MADSKATLMAFRALSALFMKKLLRPFVFLAVILLAAGYVSMLLLTLSFSRWWLLLLLVLVPLTLVLAIVTLVIRYILQKLLPKKLSKSDKRMLEKFTDTAISFAEKIRMPYPVLLFLVMKDVIRGKESQFLRSLVGDSKELLGGFEEIRALFTLIK